MADPARYVVTNAVEQQSGIYAATLRDDFNVPVSYQALTSLQLTVYDVLSGAIVGGRQAQNVLNVNQVTMDANGVITWNWLPVDMTILNPNRFLEDHIAVFEAKWINGAGLPRQANHEVLFRVGRIPQLA